MLEPRRRIDRALLAVVMEADVHGTTTRKVDDLVKALGVDAGISVGGQPDLRRAGRKVAAFRSRSLSHTAFPSMSWLRARLAGNAILQARRDRGGAADRAGSGLGA
jgi:putative transposase